MNCKTYLQNLLFIDFRHTKTQNAQSTFSIFDIFYHKDFIDFATILDSYAGQIIHKLYANKAQTKTQKN